MARPILVEGWLMLIEISSREFGPIAVTENENVSKMYNIATLPPCLFLS